MATINLTTRKVPISDNLCEASGLPLVSIIQPFTAGPDAVAGPAFASEIARCQDCLGYVNPLCTFESSGWCCALCGTLNDYVSYANHRYINAAQRQQLPEINEAVVDALSPLYPTQPGYELHHGSKEMYECDAQLACIALVDTACDEEFVEAVRSAIVAGIESLPSGALFGLISFSDQVMLHEVVNGVASIRNIPIITNGALPTTVELMDALPLENLLIPVDATGKAAISAALDSLRPVDTGNNVDAVKKRALGEALQATLRYIGGASNGGRGASLHEEEEEEEDTVAAARVKQRTMGARLLVFLSGVPNHGRGSVLVKASSLRNDDISNGEAEEKYPQYVFDPYFPELTAWNVALPSNIGHQSQLDKASEANKSYVDLSHAAAELSIKSDKLERNPKAAAFYLEAAAAAAALGVCVDVYAVSQHYVGLDMLRPISMRSGGGLIIYDSFEESSLHQDVYKRLGEPFTMQCMLRLRSSPELQVVGPMGERLQPDSQYDDLFHLACCHPHDTFAFELEHSKSSGFATRSTPVLQLVFQYLTVVSKAVAAREEPGDNGVDISTDVGPKMVLQRRTRIATVAFPLAESLTDLYNSCDASAITFAVVQQVTAASSTEERRDVKKAMKDWLTELTARYNTWIRTGDYQDFSKSSNGNSAQKTSSVDTAFAEVEALQQLPRAVYAICQGPLLGSSGLKGSEAHPDAASMLRTLCSTLPPEELAAAVYPQLSSWSSPNDLAFPRHSLSKTALRLSAQPIYLLDTYSSLIIYYSELAHGMQFPPPPDAAIRRHVAAVRQARRVTPRVIMVHEGSPEVHLFTDWLIEDGAGQISGGSTLLQFLNRIQDKAKPLLE